MLLHDRNAVISGAAGAVGTGAIAAFIGLGVLGCFPPEEILGPHR